MDGLNTYRTTQVAHVLDDFRTLQLHIASAPTEPSNSDDSNSEGWAVLYQCAIDGHKVLECAADTRVPNPDSFEEEQVKAQLKQIYLDAYSRRHACQKIYLRQLAAQEWIRWRQGVLNEGRPSSKNRQQLQACDYQLKVELAKITDEEVYAQLQISDMASGRWMVEDPSLRAVQRWLRPRV